jgi:hypothetical protein
VESRRNGAHRRFDPVLARPDPSHMGKGCHHADCSVSAHAEVPDIIEEDHGRRGLWIDGFAEEGTDDDLRSTRFTHDTAPEVIEITLEPL